KLAQENNFCCRGCELSDNEKLIRDINHTLNLSEDERQALGQYGREVIFKHYSVSKMALDCVKAYNAAWKENATKPLNILMSGYYGFNNSGDDAILLSIYSNLCKVEKNLKVVVLANNPVETKRKYGVEVAYRYNIISVIKAIKQCDLLLSGGGSLLQDKTSTRSIIYYLSIIKFAKILGKKVMLYANGIGPVEKPSNRYLVKTVVDKADVITIREQNSLEELRNMGVNNSNSFVTADPVFSLNGISKEEALKFLESKNIPTDKPIVGVSVRNWKGIESFINNFALLCDKVSKELNKTIVFIPMQIPNDIHTSTIVMNKMKEPSYILQDNLLPSETMGIISLMDFVMSMRLHTLIFAAKERIPLVGFSYDPKIDFYLEEFGMPMGGDVENYNPEIAFEKVCDLNANRDEYAAKLNIAVNKLEEMAKLNEDYLLRLLDE
ncbi:MAG: polysaccharide pyruvyl transferase CsaB, partial [Anaerotignaceae bacterium]